jgi:hypothetical protein
MPVAVGECVWEKVSDGGNSFTARESGSPRWEGIFTGEKNLLVEKGVDPPTGAWESRTIVLTLMAFNVSPCSSISLLR